MPAGPIGGSWAQTPSWSTTAWEANTWSGPVIYEGGSPGGTQQQIAMVFFFRCWLALAVTYAQLRGMLDHA